MSAVARPVEKGEGGSAGVVLTKLYPPTARVQWIDRESLIERLRPEPGIRLTALVAPAGSGKTTLLGAWQEIEGARRPVGWVTLDEGDNDPIVLWSHALEALRRLCPSLQALRSPEIVGAARITDTFLPELVNGLTEQEGAALVLDDFHRLLSGPSRESVAWLVEHAPPSFQLVVATRTEPALPLAVLRARGELIELRASDLGFSCDEADVFLNDRLELALARADVDELVQRTEGWPAGLYLAALSLRGADDRHAFVSRFGGTNRPVVDFLVNEVLDGHDPALQTLMLRCSVLDRLCAPLCDAVLEQVGSGEELRELARTNLFLVPLDDHGEWYRFHHVFRQLLRVELEYREPGLAPTLHRRASAWARENGSTNEAIDHAIKAEDFADAGDLISTTWLHQLRVCRHATVLAWFERFPTQVLESDASLLIVKAWVLSLNGKRDDAIQTVSALERLGASYQGPLPDGASSFQVIVASLRALFPWGDVASGYENAVLATELQRPEGHYWATALFSRGYGNFFRGEFEEADRWLEEAARFAQSEGRWLFAVASLAYRSFAAGELGEAERQSLLAQQAAEIARERDLEEIVGEASMALGASLGDLEEARHLLEKGAAVLVATGQPVEIAYALICRARVLLGLGDRDAATAAIAEARDMIDSCRDPGILERMLVPLERPRSRRDGKLSKRELVVLRALTGPLSERDIARELFLSHSTVHSHAQSIYRKLGVSSRADAIREARKIGLV